MKRPPPPPPPPVKFSNAPGKPPGTRPVQFGDPAVPIIGPANNVGADMTVYLYAAVIRAKHVAERVAEGDQIHPSVVETVELHLKTIGEAWGRVMEAGRSEDQKAERTELWG